MVRKVDLWHSSHNRQKATRSPSTSPRTRPSLSRSNTEIPYLNLEQASTTGSVASNSSAASVKTELSDRQNDGMSDSIRAMQSDRHERHSDEHSFISILGRPSVPSFSSSKKDKDKSKETDKEKKGHRSFLSRIRAHAPDPRRHGTHHHSSKRASPSERLANKLSLPRFDGHFSSSRHNSSENEADVNLRHSTDVVVNRAQRKVLLRVYKPNGTFGTLACPIDISCEKMKELAVRKFFFHDAENYKIVFRRANVPRVFATTTKVVMLMQRYFESYGYTFDGTEDSTFMGRLVLETRHSEECFGEIHASMRHHPDRLRLVEWSNAVFPDFVLLSANQFESLELYRSDLEALNDRFCQLAQKLRMLRIRECLGFGARLKAPINFFRALEVLDLRGNGLTSIDIDFSELPNLHSIDFSGNSLVRLPESLKECRLRYIYASTNSLEEFDLTCGTLIELDLSYNNISNIEHSIMECKQLERLILYHNCLTSLPTELEMLCNLKFLDVRSNNIMGLGDLRVIYAETFLFSKGSNSSRQSQSRSAKAKSEPVPYFHAPRLSTMEVVNSRIRMPVSPDMPKLTKLDMSGLGKLNLTTNFIRGVPNLVTLILDRNLFTKLPPAIGILKNLTHLSVASNSLSTLPPELFTLKTLQHLDLHANNLKSMPESFLGLSNLRYLNISSNLFESLTFLAPADARSYSVGASSLDAPVDGERRGSHVSNLSVSSANKSRRVSTAASTNSAEMTFQYTLRSLIAADNRLNDECFEQIALLTRLETLDVSYNEITEVPFGSLKNLVFLKSLHLSGNLLSTLPQDDLEHLTNLSSLYLNSNRLHSLPAELSKLHSLEALDVGANNLRYNVSNWPFDWNWRWNQNLRYLNFSANKRLEIKRKKSTKRPPHGQVRTEQDLTDFCVLPNLSLLGLMDVTLIFPSLPEQSENTRIRTYGCDLYCGKVGIADYLGDGFLNIQDLVLDRFRGKDSEALVGMFDGQINSPLHGNRISKLVVELLPKVLKAEVEKLRSGETLEQALSRTFKRIHAEIGNTATLPDEDMLHTTLGQHSSTAAHMDENDARCATGGALIYFHDDIASITTIGGIRVVVSRPDGNYQVLNESHTTEDSSEIKRIRPEGGVVVDKKVNSLTEFTRLIGCYTLGSMIGREPSQIEYKPDRLERIIIASAELWEYVPYEVAADIVRGENLDPAHAALKLRDFAIAYGCTSRLMITVYAPQQNHASDHQLLEIAGRRRRQLLPQDSNLARLGYEVSPPLGDVTMVFTDIRHSTMLWEIMPTVMRSAIKIHNAIMRRTLRLSGGYEVKTEGDAFIASFHTPIEALLWCLTAQVQLQTAEWPQQLLETDDGKPIYSENGTLLFQGLRVRMGIHWGRPVCEQDPITSRMDYLGPMVNKTARISGVAFGGQVAVSNDFLAMLWKYNAAHERALTEPVEQAYNMDAERALELDKRVVQLTNMGFVIVDIGELRLKGIETPENICIVYAGSLRAREFYNWGKEYVDADYVQPTPTARFDSFSSENSLTIQKTPSNPSTKPSVSSDGSLTVRNQAIGQAGASPSDQSYLELPSTCRRLESLCNYMQTGEYPTVVRVDPQVDDPERTLELYITRVENAISALSMSLVAPNADFSEILEALAELQKSSIYE